MHASFQGFLFERQALDHFCGIDTKRTFWIRGLTDPNETTWTYSEPIRHVTTSEKSTVIDKITEAVPSNPNTH